MARTTSEPNTLQTVSRKTLIILEDVFMRITLGRLPLRICIFAPIITNELFLGLDRIHTMHL
jgi:hypothetical protein